MFIGSIPEEYLEFLQETVLSPERFGMRKEYAHMVETIIDNPSINGESIRLDAGYRAFLYP